MKVDLQYYCFIAFLMNKYKTIDAPGREKSIQSALPQPLDTNKTARATLLHNDDQHQFLSSLTSDKRVVFIKLPKKPQPYTNSFRSSLYQSSLKRLKQQKVTLLKDTLMPKLNPSQKTYQSLEEEAIKKALKDSKQYKKEHKKNSLPVVSKINHQSLSKKHASYYLHKLEDKRSGGEEQSFQRIGGYESLPLSQKKSTFQIDGAVLGYKNLKQKYLQLRQLSLTDKKKSELLEKPQYRRHENEKDNCDFYDSKFKMQKGIQDHMNRYSKRDFFQTKVNGYKTTIYPPEKAHHKLDEEVKERKKYFQNIRKQEHIENFIKKKKQASSSMENTIYEHPSEYLHQNNHSVDLRSYDEQSMRRKTKMTINPEKEEKQNECSPWETDAVNFDRF